MVASDDDQEWRAVLATIFEHGQVMGRVLIKHICESLWQRAVKELPATESSSWDFPQSRLDDGVEAALQSDTQCLFALQMLDRNDRVVREAVELVNKNAVKVRHFVFVSVFLSQAAVGELTSAF